jgi:hypothetical protein
LNLGRERIKDAEVHISHYCRFYPALKRLGRASEIFCDYQVLSQGADPSTRVQYQEDIRLQGDTTVRCIPSIAHGSGPRGGNRAMHPPELEGHSCLYDLYLALLKSASQPKSSLHAEILR